MQLYYGSLAWIVLVMERWWSALGTSENHDAPTFKISAPPSSPNHTTPLRSHTLIVSNCFCHDRFISEPAAIKIIWLRARARYYCWRVSFGPRAACCWPLLYRDIRTDQRDLRPMYKPVSPECGRFLPGFCPGQTLCYWPIGHCPVPAAALLDPSPDAEAWKKRHTHWHSWVKNMFRSH